MSESERYPYTVEYGEESLKIPYPRSYAAIMKEARTFFGLTKRDTRVQVKLIDGWIGWGKYLTRIPGPSDPGPSVPLYATAKEGQRFRLVPVYDMRGKPTRNWLSAEETEKRGIGITKWSCWDCGEIHETYETGARAPRYCDDECRKKHRAKQDARKKKARWDTIKAWSLASFTLACLMVPYGVAFTMIADAAWWVENHGGGVWEEPDFTLSGFMIILWMSMWLGQSRRTR